MSKKTTVEGFDCVEMKRQIQENIDEDPFTVRLQTGATVRGGRARGSLRHDRETATRANARAIGGNLLAWRKLPPAQRAGILAAMLRDLLSGNVKHGQTEPGTPARPKLRVMRGKP